MSRTLIVLPVLNDAHSLEVLIQELAKGLKERFVSMLIVDDGSLPPIEIGSEASALPGQIITLSRTLGHQKAIAIGLAYAAAHRLADVFIIMDADGEDDPKDVERLLDEVATARDPMSIVVATRTKRSEGVAFRIFYQLYRFVFLLMTGHHISFGNFSAMPISAVQRLVAMSELWMSLPGTILRSRLPMIEVPTERGRRYRGQSRMNLVSLVTHGFGAVTAFVEIALTRMILAAFTLVACGIVASIIAFGLKLVGMATPGWLTTVIGDSLILLVGVAILSFVGLSLTIIVGAHTVPAPAVNFQQFILRISNLAPGSKDAERRFELRDHTG
jgi:polyisoprenyl-phosphate glycosyltransferase